MLGKTLHALVSALIAATAWGGQPAAVPAQAFEPPLSTDVPFVPSPEDVVDRMLQLAGVRKGDVVYDLGSGDGRIVIAAAKKYGARGVGVDIDPERIEEARENARKAGVADRVKFVQQDLFDADIHEATVVTLYLLPNVNQRLRPKLLRELKPGTRVVSHSFDMGDWKPVRTVEMDGRTLYYWVVPPRGRGAGR
ncbi:MAG: methyltransferase domain-containing protein [Pseudomonadota bacterium]